ncbi:MAG: SIS domain-containing protein [Microbacteriaceae bacterium]|nr:MAG: SIS domain-containing protein [Microbacteriaceae bacterium]
MLNFNEEEFFEQIASAARLRSEIESVVAERLDRGVKNVYFIGSGGSYADLLPYEYLMRSRSTLPARSAIGPEFALVPDATFGEGSLAIFGSATGTTDDVNRVIEFAKEHGAYTVGFTGEADSPFAKALDHVFLSSAHSYDVQMLLLLGKLLSERGEFDDYDTFADQLALLPGLLVDVAKDAEPAAEAFANKHKDTDYHFLVGSGNVWGYTYLYSMCVLEECQWLHTTRVHAAEFFHGSLELVEKDTSVVLFVGEDETRSLMDRVKKFATKYSDDVSVFDTADYALPGIDDRYRALLSPLVIGTVAARISKHLEKVRDHDLTLRRYYRVVEY